MAEALNDITMQLDALKDDLKQAKAQRRLYEIDIEKRLLNIENTMLDVTKNIKVVKNLDQANAIETLSEVKNAISRIEDISLVDKLDIINLDEMSRDINEKISAVNGKVELLSNAVKIINRKADIISGEAAKAPVNTFDVDALKAKLIELEAAVSNISAVKPVLKQDIEPLKSDLAQMKSDVDEITGIARESMHGIDKKLDYFEKKLSSLSGDFSSLSKNVGSLSNMHSADPSLISKLQSITDMFNTRLKDTEIKIKSLQSGLENARSASSGSTREGIESFNSKIDELKGQIKRVETSNASSVQNSIKEWNVMLGNVKSALNKTTQLSENFQKEMDIIEEEFEAIESKFENRLKSHSDSEANAYKMLSEKFQKEIDIIEEELQAVESKIDNSIKAGSSADAKAHDISHIENRIKSLEDAVKRDISAVERSASSSNIDLDRRIRELTKHYAAISISVNSIEPKLKSLEDNSKKNVAGLDVISSAEKELKAMDERIKDLVAQVKILSESIFEGDFSHPKYKKDHEMLKHEVNHKFGAVVVMKDVIEAIVEKQNELEKYIKSAESSLLKEISGQPKKKYKVQNKNKYHSRHLSKSSIRIKVKKS